MNAAGDFEIDQSTYTIEARILAATWWHESNQTKDDMKNVRERFSQRFNGDIPRGEKIKQWEEKLFNTGSFLDK